MPRSVLSGLSFRATWKMTLLTALICGLFIRLGFWQVHRGHEKRQLLAVYQQEKQQNPALFPSATLPRHYQMIQVQGRYLPVTFLLDNQHHEHQFGYDVLSPLLLNNGLVVMVDRGWVMGDPARLSLPPIETNTQLLTLYGQAYYPSDKAWLLGPGLEVKHEGLAVIETIDPVIMSQFLHKSLYPFIIRQSAESGDGYLRDWAIVSCSPTRHDGYALQWFMFAFVLSVIFIILHVKKIK